MQDNANTDESEAIDDIEQPFSVLGKQEPGERERILPNISLVEVGDMAPLYCALVACKPELPVIEARSKGKITDKQSFNYADLGELRQKCDPVLAKHGLCVIFPFHGSVAKDAIVSTMLIHKSGARLISNVSFAGSRNIKDFGANTTYLARYGYAKMLGLDQGDDPDDARSQKPRQAERPRQMRDSKPQKQEPQEEASSGLEALKIEIRSIMEDNGWSTTTVKAVAKSEGLTKPLKELGSAEWLKIRNALVAKAEAANA